MDAVAEYLFLSLPQSADAKEWLEQQLNSGKSPIYQVKFPDFQIGTLDSLIQESEELSKIDLLLALAISKVVDILSNVLETPSTSLSNKVVNSKLVLDYVEKFQWNTSKYRLDNPVTQLVKLIADEALVLDSDVRSSYQSYQTAKLNFLAADRKKNGDLSIKSLHEIVRPEQFVLNSDHLTTVLIAVPKSLVDDFRKTYETLTQFVVPRSAELVATDSEYSLFGVTLFKKYQQEFNNAAREKKWHPRTDFTYLEEVLDNLRKEFDMTRAAETKTKNDLVRLARTAYSDIFSCWVHIKTLRVYVESVLRYGLPPKFDFFLIKFNASTLKDVSKVKKELITKFGYLGGNQHANNQNLHEYASLVDTEYDPFVIYELPIV